MKSDPELFADQLDNDWENLPTKAEAQAAIKRLNRALEIARRAEIICAWRSRNPRATCSDFVAATLADLEACYATKVPTA